MTNESALPDLISVRELASQLAMDRSALLKALKSRGVVLHDIRGSDTRFQVAKALSREDADAFSAWRRASGAAFNSNPVARPSGGQGAIYLLRPDAEARPEYMKIGWSTDIAGRLATYRTICPHLQIKGLWAAPQQAIEIAAIAIVKTNSERQIGQELFVGDVERVKRALQQAFALMGVVPLEVVGAVEKDLSNPKEAGVG